jgi:glycosyltransferase involved in cell wall biosynthesis
MDWPVKVNWANVDVLVTVGNSYVRQAIQSQVPGIAQTTRIVTIPNGVDMDRIRLVERTRGKNIAFVGDVRMVKNPMLLLQCFKALHEIDAEYRLYWAGKSHDMLLEQYIRHAISAMGLEKAVIFDGWQSDIRGWLDGKHYIVCTSVIESQGMGVLEAMSAGLKPIVHNFPGASETFGEQWLFNTPGQFCRLVTSGEYEPSLYRRFVEQKYDLKSQLQRINGLIAGFEPHKSPSVSCTSRQGSLSVL